jgi:Tol biopolymer transport system component
MKTRNLIIILAIFLLSACQTGAPVPRLIEPPLDYDYSALPGWIAYVNFECGNSFCTNLEIVRPDFTGEKILTNQSTGLVSDIAWSPNGRTIAYSIFNLGQLAGTQLWLYDMQAGESTLLTTGYVDTPYSLSWSPDNRFLLVAGKDETQRTWSLMVLDVQTRDQYVMLEDSIYTDISADWSPAGDWIAFSAGESGGNPQLWSAATDGSSLTALTADETFANLKPSWKPDGSSLAYFRRDGQGNVALWRMNPDGQNAVEVADLDQDVILEKPVWSPDGSRLAVIHGDEEETEVLLIDLTTGEQQRLNRLDGKFSMLSFSPDQSALIFMENKGSLDHWLNMFVFNDGNPFVVSAQVDFNNPHWSPADYTP